MNGITCFGDGNGQAVVLFESTELRKLVIQTAANIIHTCRENPDVNRRLTRGANEILNDQLPAADHFYVFLLNSQVDFVYAYVKMVVGTKNAHLYLLDGRGVTVILNALTTFKEWILAGNGSLGHDMTDLNEEFVARLSTR